MRHYHGELMRWIKCKPLVLNVHDKVWKETLELDTYRACFWWQYNHSCESHLQGLSFLLAATFGGKKVGSELRRRHWWRKRKMMRWKRKQDVYENNINRNIFLLKFKEIFKSSNNQINIPNMKIYWIRETEQFGEGERQLWERDLGSVWYGGRGGEGKGFGWFYSPPLVWLG